MEVKDRLHVLENHKKSSDGCWEWSGHRLPSGYGLVTSREFKRGSKKPIYAHRLSYEAFVGPIPDGLHLDHLCRNRCCVNPAHLEPVTALENVRRGMGHGSETHCPAGHEYTADNTHVDNGGHRHCKACDKIRKRARRDNNRAAYNAYQREWRAKHKKDGPGKGGVNAAKTHCPNGHLYNDENTHVDRRGRRSCRVCGRERARQRRAALS